MSSLQSWSCQRRAFVFAGFILICAAAAAQHIPTPSIDALTQRRLQLESSLEQQRATGKSDNDAKSKQIIEELVQVAGQEDDLRQELPAQAKTAANQTKLNIPIFFVTDRVGSARSGFSAELRPYGVEYGTAIAHIEVPYPVRLDRISGAVVSSPSATVPNNDSLSNIAFFNALTHAVGPPEQHRKVLVFIHGYRVSFEEAMVSAATLASEVGYPVVPVAFSWPSAGSLLGYLHDEDTINTSSLRLSHFLSQLLQQPGLEVALVAHSMGSRELTRALLDLQRSGSPLPGLRYVAFAAADISQTEFYDTFQYLSQLHGVAFLSYTSSHDLPLRISHYFHDFPRLGDATPFPYTITGIDTVEASGVAPVYQAFGHSYICKAPRVGADLGSWIDGGLSPQNRGLLKVTHLSKAYFVLQ